MPIDITMDESMITRDGDIINNANITILSSADFYFLLTPTVVARYKLFCVDDMEYFFLIV